jgi:hypothetical protein
MAENPPELAQYQNDHDLLVGLTRDVQHLTGDIAKLTEAVNKKNDDHETRIRDLESRTEGIESSRTTWNYVVSIALVILGLGVTIIGAYISKT